MRAEARSRGRSLWRSNPRDFYVAEDYHQDYYLKNPVKYAYYRWGCGRDARLEELWGKPSS